jgi:hypothetical protein
VVADNTREPRHGHGVLGGLAVPSRQEGGASGSLILAPRAARILERIRLADAIQAARHELAAQFLDDLRRVDVELRQTSKSLLTDLLVTLGCGPLGIAS